MSSLTTNHQTYLPTYVSSGPTYLLDSIKSKLRNVRFCSNTVLFWQRQLQLLLLFFSSSLLRDGILGLWKSSQRKCESRGESSVSLDSVGWVCLLLQDHRSNIHVNINRHTLLQQSESTLTFLCCTLSSCQPQTYTLLIPPLYLQPFVLFSLLCNFHFHLVSELLFTASISKVCFCFFLFFSRHCSVKTANRGSCSWGTTR